jgi:hypothetical protein
MKVLISMCYLSMVEGSLKVLAETGKLGLAMKVTVERLRVLDARMNLR